MELSHLFILKPHNDLAKLRLTSDSGRQHVHLLYREKELVFNVREQTTILDFYTGISQSWIEFVLESSNTYLMDDTMDEFVLMLN